MSSIVNFDEMMEAGITNLLDTAEVSDVSAHATFNLPAELFPENITPATLKEHVDFINNTTAQVNAATAQLGRQAYEANNDITNFDGTLNLGDAVTINAQHVMSQDLGDSQLYGQTTVAADFVFSTELNEWQDQMQVSNAELAAKYFGG